VGPARPPLARRLHLAHRPRDGRGSLHGAQESAKSRPCRIAIRTIETRSRRSRWAAFQLLREQTGRRRAVRRDASRARIGERRGSQVAKKCQRRQARTSANPQVSGSYRAKVRMYRQGLGDCFLISLPRSDSDRPYNVLIDCGVILGTADASTKMTEVVEHIIAATQG